MKFIFYFIAPTNVYYKNPYSKDSLFVGYDVAKRNLFTESIHIDRKERFLKKKIYKVNEKAHEEFMAFLIAIEKELSSLMDAYLPAEGVNYSNGLFSFNEKEVRVPDYLTNFGDYDIFRRYNYYPNKKRVRFYEFLRKFYSFAWKTIGEHEDIAIFEKIPSAVKDGSIQVLLEKSDFDLPDD